MTRCLFLTCRDNDYLASCLFDGLQEVLGVDNVFDAVGVESLTFGAPQNPCSRISSSRIGRLHQGEKVDLLVINACVLRSFEWEGIGKFADDNPGAKIAWVEGWDGVDEFHNPPFQCDAYFRRELDPHLGHPYPKTPRCLMFSAPRRWFDGADCEKPFDVFFAGAQSSSERWDVCSQIFRTKYRHLSVAGSRGIGNEYFSQLRASKLAVCPVGGGGCFDCLRTWEAVSAGCIPIFVGYPKRLKEPWFADDEIFVCHTPEQLPDMIDRALMMDLRAMRTRMLARTLKEHTTAARTMRLLELTGVPV